MGFLHEDEKIIIQDAAKSKFFGKGTLYLTNARVVFEVPTGGFFSGKTLVIKLDQQIPSIMEVSVPAKKTLRIQFTGNLEPTEFSLDDPTKWEAAVRSAMYSR